MFSTLEKIKELAKKRGISLAKLEENLGYSTNYFYTLKTKAPNAERLAEIANYFNVSTDYLLGRMDNPKLYTTPDGKEVDLSDLRNNEIYKNKIPKYFYVRNPKRIALLCPQRILC